MRIAIRSVMLLGLAMACRPTTSIGVTAASESATTSDTTTSDGADATTSATTDDVGEATGSDATTIAGMDGSAGESSGDDSPSDPPMCMPAQFDSPCIACAKQQCCPQFGVCASEFDCGCTLGCLQYPFPGQCMCPPNEHAGDLLLCLGQLCDPACPP